MKLIREKEEQSMRDYRKMIKELAEHGGTY
jgi:hypothetical protein